VALGRIGGPAARAALQTALVKSKADMQPWVALGLGLVERRDPDGTLAPLLLERLEKESSSDARGALLIALGLSRDERAVPALEHFLTGSSSEPRMRPWLGMSGRATATPLRHGALGVRSSCARAAFALGAGRQRLDARRCWTSSAARAVPSWPASRPSASPSWATPARWAR
jgi:HEAT repeat protein